DLCHRTAFTGMILREWDRHFNAIKLELQAALGEISFTADCWSSSNMRSFLAITAHW
ncbi:hypothetical protein BDN72DRAFT_748864, partial [Pluteus cervinus]